MVATLEMTDAESNEESFHSLQRCYEGIERIPKHVSVELSLPYEPTGRPAKRQSIVGAACSRILVVLGPSDPTALLSE